MKVNILETAKRKGSISLSEELQYKSDLADKLLALLINIKERNEEA